MMRFAAVEKTKRFPSTLSKVEWWVEEEEYRTYLVEGTCYLL